MERTPPILLDPDGGHLTFQHFLDAYPHCAHPFSSYLSAPFLPNYLNQPYSAQKEFIHVPTNIPSCTASLKHTMHKRLLDNRNMHNQGIFLISSQIYPLTKMIVPSVKLELMTLQINLHIPLLSGRIKEEIFPLFDIIHLFFTPFHILNDLHHEHLFLRNRAFSEHTQNVFKFYYYILLLLYYIIII